jgi:hypothetical protein
LIKLFYSYKILFLITDPTSSRKPKDFRVAWCLENFIELIKRLNLLKEKKMNKYRIYIDETGNSDLNSSKNDNHRFLSLTGVVIRLDYVDNFLHEDMENLKKRFYE